MAGKVGGGGGDRYTIQQNADINVTPFIDIMLVLLIIFMTTIPPATRSFKLDMPPTPPNQTQDQKKPVFVQILNTGDVYVVDTKADMATLPSVLGAALLANNPENADPRQNTVYIRAESEVAYEQFMEVLNKLETNGYLKIGLINEDIT